jgi:hypothetical protein
MTKQYVNQDDSFDFWRQTVNVTTDIIGDASVKVLNNADVPNDQEYLVNHADVSSLTIASQPSGATVTITDTSNGRKLRPGMNVSATVSSVEVLPVGTVINAITYSAGNVVLTLSNSFSTTYTNCIFTFTKTVMSHINDLEMGKVDRHGDTIRGDLIVDGNAAASTTGILGTNETTFNLINTNATTVNAFGAGTDINIGAATGDLNIKNATVSLDGDLTVTGGDVSVGGTPNIVATNVANTASVFNTSTGIVNISGAATTTNIGSAAGTQNLVGDVVLNTTLADTTTIHGMTTINGGSLTLTDSGDTQFDLTTTETTFNLINTNATTVNFAGASTTTSISAGSGNTTINNNAVVTLDLAVNGGDITTSSATFNIGNTATSTQTTNIASALTTTGVTKTVTLGSGGASGSITNITLGSSTGGATGSVSLYGTTTVNGNVTIPANYTFTQNGSGTFATGTGAVSLNGNTTVADGSSFTANGNVTLGNAVGDVLDINATVNSDGILFANGAPLKTGTGSGNTLKLQAYDVDGTTYVDMITLTAGNTPTMTLNTNLSFGVIADTLTTTATISASGVSTLVTLDKTVYRSAEVIIQSTQGTTYHVTKLLMSHDGTDTFETEFGSLGTAPGAIDTAIVSNDWRININQTLATSTVYKIHATLIKV